MRLKIILLFLILIPSPAYAAKSIKVTSFSEAYHAVIILEKPEEVFSPGKIIIYDTKSQTELISVDADELDSSVQEGPISVVVSECPYCSQSPILYLDVNFDGIKDFAIQDGNNSCYGGQSYQIYLGLNGRFVHSLDFSRLSQEYCGMFGVDPKEKTLDTMIKSGCCYHETSIFKIVKNKLQAIEILSFANEDPYFVETKQKWDGHKMVKSVKRTLESDDAERVFTFCLANGKTVTLFTLKNSLNYAFVDKSGNVEFAFPQDSSDEENEDFYLTETADLKTISFKNQDAEYEITEMLGAKNKGKIELHVKTPVKSSFLIAEPSSVKGTLSSISRSLNNIR